MITVLSGGTGTPKLIQGLMQLVPQEDITVIVNTAEDVWLPHGHLSPDIDSVMYTLAGIINDETWYGIKNDTFKTHEYLVNSPHGEMLKIGDRDRETHVKRGELLKEGKNLTEATDTISKNLGISATVLPMTDSEVQTVIVTPVGNLNLHEYLIDHPNEEVNDIYFRGIETARPTAEVMGALETSEKIIIGPSNPITSILPIISLNGIRIDKSKCIAVSSIIAGKPVSGPADRFMEAKGYSPDSSGVAEIYKWTISKLVVDGTERSFEIDGIDIKKTNTIMVNDYTKKSLAGYILDL
jgi:LPPG:FO 2-phospho-L-lactate transferase